MMHPAPIRARSRTCDWFQMLVPGPISALGATSAVGWMRTDGRSFTRTPPAVRAILACRGAGGPRLVAQLPDEVAQAREGGGHRLAAVADRILLRICQFARRASGRQQ